MTKRSRADKAAVLEHWAAEVRSEDLVEVDTSDLRHLAELVDKRATLERELLQAVVAARRAQRTWAEIGAMLGVSKQAAQRKYARAIPAA